MKETIDKFDLLEIKHLCSLRGYCCKIKRKGTGCEKTFKKLISDKELASRLCKDAHNNDKRTTNLIFEVGKKI